MRGSSAHPSRRIAVEGRDVKVVPGGCDGSFKGESSLGTQRHSAFLIVFWKRHKATPGYDRKEH